MRRATCFAVLGVVASVGVWMGGCPIINTGSALGLQDWGRDLLSIPAAVIIGELIDEAQGTNEAVDPNAIYSELYTELSNDIQGERGTPGVDGVDGTDGVDGQDGEDGADGADGTDGVDGVNGTDGTDGADGADGLIPVAIGCIADSGSMENGFGYNAKLVDGSAGVYAVALTEYDFPADFDPNNLVVMVTPKAIVEQDIVTYYDAGVGYGFLVEFRDLWLNPVNTEFCFAVYDVAEDPYAGTGTAE